MKTQSPLQCPTNVSVQKETQLFARHSVPAVAEVLQRGGMGGLGTAQSTMLGSIYRNVLWGRLQPGSFLSGPDFNDKG